MSVLRSAGIFAAGAIAGAAGAVLILRNTAPVVPAARAPHVLPGIARSTSTVPRPAPPIEHRARAPDAPQAAPASDLPANDAGELLEATAPDPAWTALVEGLLEQEVELRFGRRLAPEQKSRLLGELARLREASLGLQRTPAAPHDPAALRDRLSRQVAILEVDRAFREELGIGVSDFLEGLEAGEIDEITTESAAQ